MIFRFTYHLKNKSDDVFPSYYKRIPFKDQNQQ